MSFIKVAQDWMGACLAIRDRRRREEWDEIDMWMPSISFDALSAADADN